jgi:hypothetical protein
MLVFPKPGKRERRSLFNDGREICRGEAWKSRRKECYARAGGRCEKFREIRRNRFRCNRPAALHNVIDPDYGDVMTPAGHAHHKNGTRGLGAGRRDDGIENLDWLCARCHWDERTPAKVIPSKIAT